MRGVLFLWWFSSLTLVGQEAIPMQGIDGSKPIAQYTVDSWDNEDGLPTNAVLDIEKTSRGFMWLATFNGLVRFDGVDFQVYDKSNTQQLKSNNISTLLVDQMDQLWIGTNGGGLVKMAQDQFTFYNTDSIISSNMVTALEEGEGGTIWVGTRLGLARMVNDTLVRINTGPLSYKNITTLFSDDRNRLWVGTATSGLYVLDQDNLVNLTPEHGLQSNFVRATFGDSNGRMWVGTDRGVSMVDENGIHNLDSIQGSPAVFTNTFLEDEQGNIWMGSNDGLRRFTGKFEALALGITHRIVQSLYQDDEGNIWAGTYRGGLNRLKQGKFLTLGVPEGLNNDVINVTYQDDTLLWIGSDNGLVLFHEDSIKSYNLGRRSAGNRIRDILRDSRGRLWLCTYRGLIQFEDERIVRRITTQNGLSSNNTRRIIEDQQGDLWVGTANGLNRISEDGQIEVFGVESGLRDQFVMSLFCDKRNRLWVGTDGGGAYIYGEERFERGLSEEAVNDIIFNIFQDHDGSIWFSTNRGVIYLQDSLEFNITEQHGLISNNIFQVILDDRGQVWFTSDRGLMRSTFDDIRNLATGKVPDIRNYRIFDRSDGMRTSQITAASKSTQSTDSRLWIATLKGVTVIDTEQIPLNEVQPKTALTLMKVDDAEQLLKGPINLQAGSRRLEFHYTGLSFYAPEKVRFKYRLESFDEDWVDAGDRRIAYYTNLPPGDYVFKVIASNNDGIWNRKPAFITITQEGFFYQNTWFYVLLAIGFICLGAFLYYLRSLGIKRRNVVLTNLVQERTKNIQHQNEAITVQREELKQLNTVKDKLLSVISHDLRGPIAAVAGLLGLLKSGHLNYEELMTQSASLNNEVHRLTYLLDNLLNWSKSQMQGINLKKEHIQLNTVVHDNIHIITPMSEHKNIAVINEVPEDLYVFTDLNLLSLVIRNLIMNAIKFTHPQGEIRIYASHDEGKVTISVKDNGVGIERHDLDRLFNTQSHYSKMGTANEAGTGIGLLLCKEFLEVDGGVIWAESEEGKGSSFKFTLQEGKATSMASS